MRNFTPARGHRACEKISGKALLETPPKPTNTEQSCATITVPNMNAHGGESSEEEGQGTDSFPGRWPLALGQGLATAVGPGECALAAASGLGLGLVHLGVDLVVAFGRLRGRRVGYRH